MAGTARETLPDRGPDRGPDRADVIVIGAGMAGASVAAELAGSHAVLLLEAEDQPGYHATGRSAAVYAPSYGPPVIRALTRASGRFFARPDSPHIPHALLTPRPAIFVARPDQQPALAALAAELGDALQPIPPEEACRRAPLLRPGYAAAALLDPGSSDIDVHALHQHYLRRLAAAGGRLLCRAAVTGLAHDGGQWQVETRRGRFAAPLVVNAAGAWADAVARLAGLPGLGLQPKRRSALIVDHPAGPVPEDWPMIVDAEEAFYVKPDAGRLLISPADATPSPPCDAQPEEWDVALCVDRVTRACDITVTRIGRKWAGLRSFLADGEPAAGFDPAAPGFFWLAGQGGYGIQTAPALSRAAAAILRGAPLPADIAAEGVSAAALAPDRPSLAAAATAPARPGT